jgi:hypothetical protein
MIQFTTAASGLTWGCGREGRDGSAGMGGHGWEGRGGRAHF